VLSRAVKSHPQVRALCSGQQFKSKALLNLAFRFRRKKYLSAYLRNFGKKGIIEDEVETKNIINENFPELCGWKMIREVLNWRDSPET